DSLTNRPRAKDQHVRRSPLDEGTEDGKVARIGCRIIALRGAAHRREGRFVHIFGSGDSATDGFRICEKLTRLLWGPDAASIARPRTDGERCDNLRIHRV